MHCQPKQLAVNHRDQHIASPPLTEHGELRHEPLRDPRVVQDASEADPAQGAGHGHQRNGGRGLPQGQTWGDRSAVRGAL